MTDAVIDTVALIRHLTDSLPAAAESAFRQAESGRSQLYIPEVALGEFAYLGLEGKLGIPRPRAIVEEVLTEVRGAGYIRTCGLTPLGWESFLGLEIAELHGRMIAAAALERQLPLVSNDPAFESVTRLKLLWR